MKSALSRGRNFEPPRWSFYSALFTGAESEAALLGFLVRDAQARLAALPWWRFFAKRQARRRLDWLRSELERAEARR